MKDQAITAFQSVARKINPYRRKNCFELFGLDYMLDEDLNCWLIEVNTNPCLEESSKILEVLLPRMLDDMFKLTIDKVFNSERKDKNLNKDYHSNGPNLITSVLK